MPYAVWTPVFSVNSTELDTRHQALVGFINEAYDHLSDQAVGTRFLSGFFQRLIDHASLHFSTEEKYFTKFYYPEAAPILPSTTASNPPYRS